MSTPRVSVVMSVFNGAAYLTEAIRSICTQTFGDFEFLIVDDHSQDRSASVIADRAAVADVAQRSYGVVQRIHRADMGFDSTRDEQLAQLHLVAGELVGGDVLELKPQHVDSLDENQVQWDAGDDPRGEPDADEATAPAQ